MNYAFNSYVLMQRVRKREVFDMMGGVKLWCHVWSMYEMMMRGPCLQVHQNIIIF